MDERYTGRNNRRRTGSSMNTNSDKDFVFDWRSPDMDTTPSARSSASSNKNTRSTYRPSTPVQPAVRRTSRPQPMSEKDILMFGDEEQESGTFDGRRNHTHQRSAVQGRIAAKKSNPVGNVLGGIGSAIGGVFSAIADAVSGLFVKKASPRRASVLSSDSDQTVNTRGTGSTRRRKKKKNMKRLIRVWMMRILFLLAILLIIGLIFFGIHSLINRRGNKPRNNGNYPEYVDEQLLTINKYSRPGQSTDSITNIVIHSTTESGASANDVRKYYENLATSQETRLSSNFIVGLTGEVIVCIPDGEMSYCSNTLNRDCVAIEYCHEEISGEMSEETYNSLVNITAWLCKKYKLKTNDIIRHYDINKRTCPAYFVDHEDSWNQFRKDVAKAMKNI